MSEASHPSEDRLLTPNEVASLVTISLRKLWRLKSARALPRPIYIGRSPRWWRSAIIRWLDGGCPPQEPDQE